MKHPIDHIQWVNVNELHFNNYNPNVVQDPEMQLLKHSLLVDGWLQPILVRLNDDKVLEVVDGFHRATLAKVSPELHERDGGMVPIAILNKTRAEGMVT